MENKGFMSGLSQYFSDVKSELGKVTWPTRKDIVRYTIIVIVCTFLFAALLGGLDAIILPLLQLLVN